MAYPTTIQGDLSVNGQISGKTMAIPAGTIDNTAVASGSAGAFIAASKLQHRIALHHTQNDGTAVLSASQIVHICKGAATAAALYAVVNAAPTAAKTAIVNAFKSTAGSTFSSILSSAITFNSTGTTALTAKAGTLSVTSFAAGDLLKLSVVVSTSTGTQAQGINVTLLIDEEPSV